MSQGNSHESDKDAYVSPLQLMLMINIKPRFVFGILVAAVVVAIAIIEINLYRREHTVFDSQKWKTDITSRDEMPHPVVKGMSKSEVIKLYGMPDGKDSSDKDGTFIYLMPSGSTKGIYAVMFDKNVVVDTRYDDSGDDSYPNDRAGR